MAVRDIAPVGRVEARIRVPGSKSLTNRALVCAALARGESRIINASDSDDTKLLINGLNQLGILVRRDEGTLVVEGRGGEVFAPKFPIPVDNAGTTFRFLMALAALADGPVAFEVDQRMAGRPVEEYVAAMKELGITAERSQIPTRLVVDGRSATGGSAAVQSDRSSQFLSALLMTGGYLKEGVALSAQGEMVSRPFVRMTMSVMSAFGVGVEEREAFCVAAGAAYTPTVYVVEPDAACAGYFLAAAAVTGGEVHVEGLAAAAASRLQADVQLIDVLAETGCDVRQEGGAIIARGPEVLRAVDVDMSDAPDAVPTLAVVALFANGTTRLRDVSHLRYKESDRLAALTEELRKLGSSVGAEEDALVIEPAALHGAQLDTYDDHRLAMSFAIIGLRVPGISIENPRCVKKSFPAFWREFEKLQ